MKKLNLLFKSLFYTITPFLFLFSCSPTVISIDDTNGVLGKTNAPVSVELILNKNQINAAEDGRLALIDPTIADADPIPVQLESTRENTDAHVVFIMPDGNPGIRNFELIENKSPINDRVKVIQDSKSGQVIIEEADEKVLQYNYQTVYKKDVVRPSNDKNVKPVFSRVSGVYFDEYLKSHPEINKDTIVSTSIYAVPRSDYIHPLYGLNGEMLTRDWPDSGHPHHRAIFWAWPEVEYGSERGDIYALQRVFARPTGNIKFSEGPVYAQVVAENLWMWEDTEPIVREHAVIRVYRSTTNSRIIDLTIKLLALKDSITIATRFTNSYGGLNLRMQTPESQEISFFTDEAESKPVRAWSDFNGVFKGDDSPSGLMVLQHHDNPDYPGDWAEYPDLAWVQPTFPALGTRYPLSTEKALILRYRLIVHVGGKPGTDISEKRWDAYNEASAPIYNFETAEQ